MRRAVLYAMVAGAWACSGDDGGGDPGRVTLHRLNNVEYGNTVRDLLGTTLAPEVDFPADDRGYGFDNVADVLRMSTLSMELYESAAEALIADALAVTTPSSTQTFEIMGDAMSGNAQAGGWLFFSNGTAAVTAATPIAATYRITVRAYGQQAGPDPARLSIEVPGQPVRTLDVTAVQASPQNYSITAPLPAGNALITVGFANDYYDMATMADRNLWIDHVAVEGPLDGPVVDGGKRGRILTCAALDDRACQTQILTGFAGRAWRRPARPEEITRLLADVVDVALAEGDTAEAGLTLALQAILVSPHFLFRVELDPDPRSLVPHPLTDWEVASRLSYFLWSSMPDDALFAAAAAGTLNTPAELERQVRRMLADPRAVALTDNFAGQWLFIRALGDQDPDYALYPDYDDELEAAMRAETRRFFQAFLQDGVPMDQFLTADFTFVNDRLARHYGLPAVGTDDLVRVSLADSPRRGFLMQGSFLRVTSRPKRTSPVLRGKWILDNLLCRPPPPPPPGVEGLPDGMTATGSVRDRLEAHITNPVCASCHRVMDPLGFGLDNYDAIGAWRTMDGGYPVDASGHLGDGLEFADGREMVAHLAQDPAVYRCMVEKLYTYTGRSPFRLEASDAIDALTRRFIAGGYQLPELIVDLVTSPTFTSRRGEP